MMKRFTRRRGISLFEVLIVVAMITILSTAFFLSAIEVAGSADAAKIITDLTAIKKATLSWYADNRETFKEMHKKSKKIHIQSSPDYLNDITKYLNNPAITLNVSGQNKIKEGTYAIFNVNKYRTTWYVGYRFTLDEKEDVKDKLAGKKETLGLHFSNQYPNPDNLDPGNNDSNVGDDIVWMHILGDLSATSW